jgi:hypothetical protein
MPDESIFPEPSTVTPSETLKDFVAARGAVLADEIALIAMLFLWGLVLAPLWR